MTRLPPAHATAAKAVSPRGRPPSGQPHVPRPPWAPVQLKAKGAASPAARTAALAPAPSPRLPNRTGLSDRLKAGVEALSGLAMDDVRVHRNSSEPAKLGALAFAQANAIHLGAGHEEHLPHEAWHVVQQKQGRVRPTRRLNAVPLNEDPTLEAEASRMGTRALQASGAPGPAALHAASGTSGEAPVQRTTIGIEYYEGDAIFPAYFEETPAPFPIHFFSGKGGHAVTFRTKSELSAASGKPDYSMLASVTKDASDTTRLHIVSHGSPGQLASVDFEEFFPELIKLGVLGPSLTEIRLSACYAMMRRVSDDRSVALRVAEWVSSNLTSEIAGPVRLVAGYTANSSGLFASGQPSYEPLTPASRLGAQPVEAYLYHAVVSAISERRAAGEEFPKISKEGLKQDVGFAASDLRDALLAMLASSSAQAGDRVAGEEFSITPGAIERKEQLQEGPALAYVNQQNWKEFPELLVQIEHLPKAAVKTMEAAVESLIKATIPEAKSEEKEEGEKDEK